jgi:hypothetical protein
MTIKHIKHNNVVDNEIYLMDGWGNAKRLIEFFLDNLAFIFEYMKISIILRQLFTHLIIILF